MTQFNILHISILSCSLSHTHTYCLPPIVHHMLWLAVFISVKCWLLLLQLEPVCCGCISWNITHFHWPMYKVKQENCDMLSLAFEGSASLSPDYPRVMAVDYRITRQTIELGSLLRGFINIHNGAVASLGVACTERMGLLWRITQKSWYSQKRGGTCIHF